LVDGGRPSCILKHSRMLQVRTTRSGVRPSPSELWRELYRELIRSSPLDARCGSFLYRRVSRCFQWSRFSARLIIQTAGLHHCRARALSRAELSFLVVKKLNTACV
jgi:hypothetical protein